MSRHDSQNSAPSGGPRVRPHLKPNGAKSHFKNTFGNIFQMPCTLRVELNGTLLSRSLQVNAMGVLSQNKCDRRFRIRVRIHRSPISSNSMGVWGSWRQRAMIPYSVRKRSTEKARQYARGATSEGPRK